MSPTKNISPTNVALTVSFDLLQNPDRILLRDTLISLSVTSADIGPMAEEEKLLAFAFGMRIACTHLRLDTIPLCAELGVVMDTLLQARYSQVTFKPASVTITKRYDTNYAFVGGTVEVKTNRGHGNVRNIMAKI